MLNILPKSEIDEQEFRKDLQEVFGLLSQHHRVFAELWHIGMPVLSKDIPTACIMFDRQSATPLQFVFNPQLWLSINGYTRAWITVHEMCHILLNHGPRGNSVEHYAPEDQINRAMDLPVNHMTINSFGFERDKIIDADKYCWIDTVFPDIVDLSNDLSFEEYLDMLRDNSDNADGGGSGEPLIVDVHDFCNMSKDILDQVFDKFTNDELEELQEMMSNDKCDIKFKKETKPKVHYTNKWEKVVRKWKRKGLSNLEESDSWRTTSRRYAGLSKDLRLPNREKTIDVDFSASALNTVLFVDVSPSCESYINRFVEAARTLSPNRFRKKTFVFANTVSHEVDLSKQTPQVGFGTNFSAVYDAVKSLESQGHKIDIVMILTDLQCTVHQQPKSPQKWHWFVINYESNYRMYAKYVPKKAHMHDLNDFFMV